MASKATKALISKLGINIVPLANHGLLRSEDVKLGEGIVVAGYPYGDILGDTIKVTTGVVSAVMGLANNSAEFQVDAAVQPGNSGGPIYDKYGNIVGVVVSQLNKFQFAKTLGTLPENVNFAIKGSTVRQFLTSNGLQTKWSNRTQNLSTQKIAQIAESQTVLIRCGN